MSIATPCGNWVS